MLNLTVDDANAQLSYGPGWGVASSEDGALTRYFQTTYHASETPGAIVNFTFSGVAIYLYGSKGPNRGDFSVRYDSKVQLLSAHADELQYQQLLFKTTFDSDATPHSLTLNNTSTVEGRKWVDLDFLTISSNGGSSDKKTAGSSSTISPLPVSSLEPVPSPIGPESSESSPTPSDAATSSSSNKTTFVLAIVFGTILFLFIIGISIYLIMRARRTSSGKHIRSSPSTSNPRDSPGPSFVDIRRFSMSSNQQKSPVMTPPRLLSPSNVHPTFNSVAPFQEHDAEAEKSDDARGSSPSQRPVSALLRTNPWSPIKALLGAKDGSDSMKSTFLKV